MNLEKMLLQYRKRSGRRQITSLSDFDAILDFNEATEKMDGWAEGRGIETTASYANVENQREFTLPDDFLAPIQVKYLDHPPLEKTSWEQIRNTSFQNSIGEPSCYALFGTKLIVEPAIGSAAKAMALAANISKTASSLTLTYDADNDFINSGRGLIDSEVIAWQHYALNGSVVTLSLLERGLENTRAMAHTAGATLTQRGLELLYYAKGREFICPPDPATGKIVLASGGNVDAGDHNYLWTFYDPDTNRESLAHRFGTLTIVGGTQTVQFRELADDADDAGWQKRIYRTLVGTTSPYYLVTTLESGTTSYNDDNADSAIAGNDTWNPDLCMTNYPAEFHEIMVNLAAAIRLRELKRYEEYDRLQLEAYAEFMMKLGTHKDRMVGRPRIKGQF